MHVAFPRIIPANHTTNHTRESYHESYPWFWSHVLKHAGYYYGIGKSWWSLFCGSKFGVYVYLLACRPCLSRYGRSQGCQTMSPEWPSTQDVHLFLFCIWQSSVLLLYFCRNSLLPESYRESYPIHTPNHTQTSLCCAMAQSAQSPAWCRREPFDIGYSLYVDSKEGGANHTPNHTSETYLETYLRIIPPMQHALLTTEFSYTAIYSIKYLEPKWPLFLKVNPPKQGRNSNQNKGAPFGFQVYTYTVIVTCVTCNEFLFTNKSRLIDFQKNHQKLDG